MQVPTSAELLDVWASASALAPTARSLALLAAAGPENQPRDLADIPIGVRDGLLLDLRGALFGGTLKAAVTCVECGEKLEVDVEASSLASATPRTEPKPLYEMCVAHWNVSFYLPNSRDLAATEGIRDTNEAARKLLEGCLSEMKRDGMQAATVELPPDVAEAVGERMAELDPYAAPDVKVDCPTCGCSWHAPLDLAEFFWTEVDAWARRTLHQIHELASAYSWTEAEVLALSPAKRARYLELVAG